MRSFEQTDAPLRRVVLTGFMGSGKTSVGRLLAARLGWAFVDLDDRIAAREGMSVPKIFATRGEAAFRAAESAALAEALQAEQLVLALGGGAVESHENAVLLTTSEQTAVVFLAVEFAASAARCEAQALDAEATPRPNFADRDAAEARFARRVPLYRDVAHVEVETSARTLQEVADAVYEALFAL